MCLYHTYMFTTFVLLSLVCISSASYKAPPLYTILTFNQQKTLKATFIPRMDDFFAQFSATSSNPSPTATPPNSSSNISIVCPITSDPTLSYEPTLHPLPYMQTSPRVNYQAHGHGYPYPYLPLYSSFPMGQSSVPFTVSNSQVQGWSQPQPREEDRKMMEAMRCKIAREKRKQRMQRNRSSSAASGTPSIPAGESIREQSLMSDSETETQYAEYRTPHVFYTPDGKRLEEFMAKKLQNSDVGNSGRVVLPKREVEEKFPALEKEGVDIILKDVYSWLEWKVKLKYWINNRSRMYLLENTGDLVNHYQLQVGDSITLYEDQFKNMYVVAKKEGPRRHGTYNYVFMQTYHQTQQAMEEAHASVALLTKAIGQTKEEENAKSFLTPSNGGDFSSGGENNNVAQDALPNNSTEEASNQVAGQATEETATSPLEDQTTSTDDEQQNSLDEVYESLDNILEVNWGH